MAAFTRTKSKNVFRGLTAFPITPTNAKGEVNLDALTVLLQRLVRHAGIDSIGILGSTGTYAYLSPDERLRTILAARNVISNSANSAAGRNKQHNMIVGIGALRTDTAVDLARDAEAAGADGVLLAPVSYTPLYDEEVFQHVQTVARAMQTSTPMCIYNNPSTTHFVFSKSLLIRLATEIKHVKAFKMPLPHNVAEELKEFQQRGLKLNLNTNTDTDNNNTDNTDGDNTDDFVIGYSGDWGCGQALLLDGGGADSWFSVLAGTLPIPAIQLYQAAKQNDVATFERLQADLAPLWLLFQKFGSLRVVYTIIQELQLLGNDFDYDASCCLPKPILPLSGQDRVLVMDALRCLPVE